MEKIVKSLLKKAFVEYDLDGSGYLERPEMRKFIDDSCKEVSIPGVSEPHLDKIISCIDGDRDGKISFKEFSELMKPMIEKQLGISS